MLSVAEKYLSLYVYVCMCVCPGIDAGKESMEDLNDEEKNEKEKQNSDLEGFRKWLKEALGEKITRVEVSYERTDLYVVLSSHWVAVNDNENMA